MTPTQARLLAATFALEEGEGACGYIPASAGEWSALRALARRGLMRYAGQGVCLDESRTPPGGNPEAFHIFELTEAGRAAGAGKGTA